MAAFTVWRRGEVGERADLILLSKSRSYGLGVARDQSRRAPIFVVDDGFLARAAERLAAVPG